MLRIGEKVVCIDDAPPRNDCGYVMPLRLARDAVYTVRDIHSEPDMRGYGVRLVELENPSIVWSDGRELEWSYQSERFRPLVSVVAEGRKFEHLAT